MVGKFFMWDESASFGESESVNEAATVEEGRRAFLQGDNNPP
jgi:hypothetical protein